MNNKKLYKVVIQEIESFTTYIYANSKKDAKNKVIFTDVNTRSNQDFEQKILHLKTVSEDNYPIGITTSD